MKRLNFILLFTVSCNLFFVACNTKQSNSSKNTINNLATASKNNKNMDTTKVIKTEEEWKNILNDEEFHVLREAGTDRAFTGKYTDYSGDGNYFCKACGNLLFTSETKYHSGCGWPAFYDNAGNSALEVRVDNKFGMSRIEVLCKKCNSHLGHVFEDGPRDKTGLRYCINSTSIDFNDDSVKVE